MRNTTTLRLCSRGTSDQGMHACTLPDDEQTQPGSTQIRPQHQLLHALLPLLPPLLLSLLPLLPPLLPLQPPFRRGGAPAAQQGTGHVALGTAAASYPAGVTISGAGVTPVRGASDEITSSVRGAGSAGALPNSLAKPSGTDQYACRGVGTLRAPGRTDPRVCQLLWHQSSIVHIAGPKSI
jgi:hypothetical protein